MGTVQQFRLHLYGTDELCFFLFWLRHCEKSPIKHDVNTVKCQPYGIIKQPTIPCKLLSKHEPKLHYSKRGCHNPLSFDNKIIAPAIEQK